MYSAKGQSREMTSSLICTPGKDNQEKWRQVEYVLRKRTIKRNDAKWYALRKRTNKRNDVKWNVLRKRTIKRNDVKCNMMTSSGMYSAKGQSREITSSWIWLRKRTIKRNNTQVVCTPQKENQEKWRHREYVLRQRKIKKNDVKWNMSSAKGKSREMTPSWMYSAKRQSREMTSSGMHSAKG